MTNTDILLTYTRLLFSMAQLQSDVSLQNCHVNNLPVNQSGPPFIVSLPRGYAYCLFVELV